MNITETSEEFTYTFVSELQEDELESFTNLQKRLDTAARYFEGYQGQKLSYSSQQSGLGLICTSQVTFTSLEHCLGWLDSKIRRNILYQAENDMNYQYQSKLEPHSFDQWLKARTSNVIPTWKINLLVWLALYPSVMILILISQNSLGRLPLPLNMLISNAITVAVTGWWFVPWLSEIYSDYLSTKSKRLNLVYSATIIGLLILLLGLFSVINTP